jgi:hypothetical protein
VQGSMRPLGTSIAKGRGKQSYRSVFYFHISVVVNLSLAICRGW